MDWPTRASGRQQPPLCIQDADPRADALAPGPAPWPWPLAPATGPWPLHAYL